jgi:hypothetical protein
MSRGGPSGGRCGWCCGWSCSRGPLGRHRMYVGAGQPPVRVCCTASFSPPDARLDPSGQLWTVPLWILSCRPAPCCLAQPPSSVEGSRGMHSPSGSFPSWCACLWTSGLLAVLLSCLVALYPLSLYTPARLSRVRISGWTRRFCVGDRQRALHPNKLRMSSFLSPSCACLPCLSRACACLPCLPRACVAPPAEPFVNDVCHIVCCVLVPAARVFLLLSCSLACCVVLHARSLWDTPRVSVFSQPPLYSLSCLRITCGVLLSTTCADRG